MISTEQPVPAANVIAIRSPVALPSDAAAIGDTIDDIVISIMGWAAEAREQTVSYVASDRARSAMRVLWERTDNRLIGCVQVRPVDPDGIRRTLGRWMGPAHRGRGYMLEALGGLLPALHLHGTDVIEARTAQENVAMQRLLSAAGFMSVAEESHTLPNGAVIGSLLFEKWLIPLRGGLSPA